MIVDVGGDRDGVAAEIGRGTAEAGSAYGVLNQMLGPEQPNICAHRNTCLQARQWIINIISHLKINNISHLKINISQK